MLIKICGLTTVEDAKLARQAGADWLGLNLFAGPRRIDMRRLRQIIDHLDDPAPVVALVGIDGDGGYPAVLAELRESGVRHLQVYGNLSADHLRRLREDQFEVVLPWPVADRASLRDLDALLRSCGDAAPSYVLLDAHDPDRLGGTGQRADWEAIRDARGSEGFGGQAKIIVAGGLTPLNVAQAVRMLAPDGVDVASGVESSPGHKDVDKMAAFIAAARNAAGAL